MSRSRWNFTAVLVVGVALAIVVVTAGVGYFGKDLFAKAGEKKAEKDIAPKASVAVCEVVPETIELVETFHGMVRPLERFVMAFEVPGRLESFGTSAAGEPLDESDAVEAGQVLAVLDQRTFNSRLKEARARLEQAQYDMKQADRLRAANANAISDAEYQDWVTKLLLAQAQEETAAKNLEDATLVSPVAGVITRRVANVGESVNMHQTIMEVIQVDRVLLVVGVPESRIEAIRVGQIAHVRLLARGQFGAKTETIDGQVHRVAAAADDRSGLFEVEIILDNSNGLFRPGHVAVARIVVGQVDGFRLPVQAALVRDGRPILFAVDEQSRAQEFVIGPSREQDGELILLELPEAYRKVVVRGQHRLVPNRDVQVIAEGNGP